MAIMTTKDTQTNDLIQKEIQRQQKGLVMIPSENYAGEEVLKAVGSPLSNKYAEGYPEKRYYTGNKFVDQVENLAIERAKELFGFEHANVQPHSGSTANQAVLTALLNPRDKILSMNLNDGGHLSHGSPVNFTGKTYQIVSYGVDENTERLNYEAIEELAKKERPKLIISGSTSYPRQINFEKISEIAKSINAYHLADISHVAGLVAAGIHYPCQSADIVTTTTHKTLRGPRGAMILCHQDLSEKIDKAVFPGLQGGPLENVIAGKAVCLFEANQPEFKEYAQQVLNNAQALAKSLVDNGLRLVSDGTDCHLILIDVSPLGINGKEAALALEKAEIYTNKNVIPFEKGSPFKPSGIRLGTPALTTRGMKEAEMEKIGSWIALIIKEPTNEELQVNIRSKVEQLTQSFPIY